MKKQKIGTLAHLFIILVSLASFSTSGMPPAGAGASASIASSGSGGGMLWNRTYGGPGMEFGYSLHVLDDGGFIIVGSTFSFNASTDVLLVRTDSEGNMLWNRTYGGPGDEVGYSLQVLGDGGFIIAGYVSFDTNMDVLLVRTDPEGDVLWNRTYGGPQFEYASSIQETGDGGYIVVGVISSRPFEVLSEDVYLLKTDSEGNMLWNRTYGRSKNEEGYPLFEFGNSVHETGDGGYIIAGSILPHGKDGDVLLIKTDSEGNMLWNRTYGGPDTEVCCSSIVTSDGGHMISGYTRGLTGEEDVYLLKTDSEGNVLWNKTYGGPGMEEGSSVRETGDGGYIIAGDKTYGEEYADVYLLKTDSEGNMLWNRTYGGPGIEEGLSALAMGDGGYTVVGIAVSPDLYTSDIYLVRVAPCPVPSSVSCRVSANTTIAGDLVAVTGTVTPCVPHRDVTLTYSMPDGTTLKRTVKTDSDSFFRDEYAPDMPGSWGVAASMEGGVYIDASTSEPAAFTVEAPQGGVPLYLYGSLVAVAAIAVLAALLLRRR